MKRETFFLIILTCFTISRAGAQIDIHSQYYFNELMLNPAMTGLIESKWRLKHHRRYISLEEYSENHNTTSFDMKFLFNKKFGEYGFQFKEYTGWMMGVGLMDNRGFAGPVQHKFSSDYLSLAFHKMLKSKNYFSFGFQPGVIQSEARKSFDLNAGIQFGIKQIECWTEDQFFRTQAGFSVYHIFSGKEQNDSVYIPQRKLQFHGGYLIREPEHFNIFANAALWYDTSTHFSIGANVLFFPVVHYRFYDRARLGIHYRTSGHLVFSGGFRLYGGGLKTLSLDLTASYDLGLGFIGIQTGYRRGFEFGLVLTPLRKCWSLSKC
jgi:hypothetical protein